jgi:hypothetical protein
VITPAPRPAKPTILALSVAEFNQHPTEQLHMQLLASRVADAIVSLPDNRETLTQFRDGLSIISNYVQLLDYARQFVDIV